jgi:hypothetical protein
LLEMLIISTHFLLKTFTGLRGLLDEFYDLGPVS